MAAPTPNYLDPRVLSQIARLEMRARLVVEGYISGIHRSPYHGQSVEFAAYREYVPGDDTRHIDWKVWGRADRFVLKQYEEETNLACHLLVDCSKSMAYGRVDDPKDLTKYDYAATLAATLTYLLQRQQDAVGAVLFDNDIRQSMPAMSHPRQLRTLVHALESSPPDNTSDVDDVFAKLPAMIRRRGVVILISDLMMGQDALASMLKQLRFKRHEVIVFHVLHGDEITFPFDDNTMFKGLEVSSELLAEPDALRKGYLEALAKFQSDMRRVCAKSGCEYVGVNTHDHLDAVINSFLTARQNQSRRGSRV